MNLRLVIYIELTCEKFLLKLNNKSLNVLFLPKCEIFVKVHINY